MAKRPPFNVSTLQRDGIRRAAKWHDMMSKIFRDAIAERQKFAPMLGYAEHLWRAETHEDAAKALRELLQQTPGA